MKSYRIESFRKCFEALPADVRERACKAFELWKSDPSNNGIDFKKLKDMDNVFQARIGDYRAFATKVDDAFVWFWIGAKGEAKKLYK